MIARVVFVALAGAAVFAAVVWRTGDTDASRSLGGFVALVAAVMALWVLIHGVLTRDGGPGTIVLDDADGTPGFAFRASYAKYAATFVILLIGLVATVNGARSGITWLWAIAAALAAALVVGVARVRRRPALRITSAHVGPLHWDQVEAIVVRVLPAPPRLRFVRLEATYGDDVDLNSWLMIAGPEFVAGTLNAYLRDPDRRTRIGTEAELERITRTR